MSTWFLTSNIRHLNWWNKYSKKENIEVVVATIVDNFMRFCSFCPKFWNSCRAEGNDGVWPPYGRGGRRQAATLSSKAYWKVWNSDNMMQPLLWVSCLLFYYDSDVNMCSYKITWSGTTISWRLVVAKPVRILTAPLTLHLSHPMRLLPKHSTFSKYLFTSW